MKRCAASWQLLRLPSLSAMGLLLACCAGVPLSPACRPADTNAVYLVGRGWRTEIGVPVTVLSGKRKFYLEIFPGAAAILFGYGRKTLFPAPAIRLEKYVIGPFPGPAEVQVFAMTTTSNQTYAAGELACCSKAV
ncbi:hypothetical protein HLH44_16905 [Gluconacetobacter sp. 1c LMG 22058]|uniref:Uncharacterized protein n=1 Tax=Gluconacetobacter dulcium TaxID=2729096 RepID=A0A7W4K2B8_9PROT|nr:hypothetical protein [Gluconacetobacter dulcium]MBB2199108.1 hypothetical protein [Gluconacetobacter dulcium]